MRRWAVLRLDAGQKKMGVHGVLPGLFFFSFFFFTTDGLFDVELKELDRQRHREGFYSIVSSHGAIQSKAKSYFNFLEVGSTLGLRWHCVFLHLSST